MAQFSRDCTECPAIALHLLLQGLGLMMLCGHSQNHTEAPAIALVACTVVVFTEGLQ